MINNIQVLRAVAAMMVVYFHIIVTLSSYGMVSWWTENVYTHKWGAMGVDVFFVISGFIMMLSTRRQPSMRVGTFLKKRIIRIAPLYWLVTLGMAGIYMLMPTLFREKSIGWDDVFHSLMFHQYLIYKEWPVVLVGWSLEYEMLFYIVFTISLWISKMWGRVAFVTVCLVSLWGIGLDVQVFEFIAGMLIYLMYEKYNGLKMLQHWSWALVGMGWGLLIANSETYYFYRMGIILGASLIVLGFLVMKPIRQSLLLQLGNASYMIYLVQLFVIIPFYKLLVMWGPHMAGIGLLSGILCFILSMLVGYGVHRWLELPLLTYLQKEIKK